MSSKPNLRLGPDQDVADGVLDRRRAITELVGDPGDTLFVSGLAGSKDDVLHVVGADSPAAFSLSGAMGAAVAMGLGLALAQQGDFKDAIESYRAALRLDPNHEKAHKNIGIKIKNQSRSRIYYFFNLIYFYCTFTD